MRKIIVAAKSDNDVIGKDNELVWHMPADERFLMEQIRGCFLLTGRASFESSQGGDIFAGRRDVVILTRQPGYRVPGAVVANSVADALQQAEASGADRLCILGGAEVYRQTIDLADELIITEVHTIVEGDAFFPPIDPGRWEEAHRIDHPADDENPYPFSFVRYRRRFI